MATDPPAMSIIQTTPSAAAEIALLRKRLLLFNAKLRAVTQAGNALAVYAPESEVRRWKEAKR